MKVTVIVKTRVKEEKVHAVRKGEYRVSVKEPPAEGKANRAAVRLLARHFRVPQAAVRIVSGHSSKRKMIGIDR